MSPNNAGTSSSYQPYDLEQYPGLYKTLVLYAPMDHLVSPAPMRWNSEQQGIISVKWKASEAIISLPSEYF